MFGRIGSRLGRTYVNGSFFFPMETVKADLYLVDHDAAIVYMFTVFTEKPSQSDALIAREYRDSNMA